MRTERLAEEPAAALAALLDLDDVPLGPGGELPPLWHWSYLLARPRQSDLGPDGHALHGLPAPPGPGLSRLFGGGRVLTHAGLRVGAPATRVTRVVGRVDKVGASGRFTVVTVRSELSQEDRVLVVDEQDVVYRPPGPVAAAPPADRPVTEEAGTDGLHLDVDPVLLFRFSALTYNAHRIHYDREHARSDGHPDLVVHGPLQALLMGERLRRTGTPLVGRQYRYRLLRPTHGAQRLTATSTGGPSGSAQVRDGRGVVTAEASLLDLPAHP